MFGRRKSAPVEDVTANVDQDVALAALVAPPIQTGTPFYDWHNDAIYQVQCYLFGKAMGSVGAERTSYLLLRAEIDNLRITVENVGGAFDGNEEGN